MLHSERLPFYHDLEVNLKFFAQLEAITEIDGSNFIERLEIDLSRAICTVQLSPTK